MRIFNWIHSKINGKPNPLAAAPDPRLQKPCQEEFSDWPNGLLAIGTFGNNNVKDLEKTNRQPVPSGNQHDLKDLPSDEEFGEFQRELKQFLHKQSSLPTYLSEESVYGDLPVENFFDCLQNLENDQAITDLIHHSSAHKQGEFQRSRSVGHSGGRDVQKDNIKGGISAKSLSFLLKKTLLCGGGISAAPIPRDPLVVPKFEKSRMEKILRAILHKKIYPQGPSPKVSTQKYLDDSYAQERNVRDKTLHTGTDGSKWVKTDSDFIVLEI